jgi:hypothetical protein
MKQTKHIFLFQNSSQLNKIREITRRNASCKMTKLLLTVSTSYLIICGPYACIHTWRLLYGQRKTPTKFIRQLEYYFHLIYHISFAMNFYIYLAFGSKFRRELKRFLMKCKINFYHCFRHKNFYDNNDDSLNQNNSSNFENFQLMDQNFPCPLLTKNDLPFKYKWKQSKELYI